MNDLISREAVISIATSSCLDLDSYDDTDEFCNEVKELPSAFDGMTNGEVIQALFPQSYFLNDFPFVGSSMEKIYIDNKKDNKTHIMAQEDWWNAPYKAESEGKAE